MRRPAVLIAAGILASLAVTGVAPGDPAKPPGKEDGEALNMSADQLDLDVEAKTAQLTGHVRLARGAFTLRCPRVDVRYDQVPHVTWARGSGGVVAEVKGVKAEAPEVEVDLAARTMELHGGVRLSRGEGWITAERASINIATGKVSMSDVKGSIPVPSASAVNVRGSAGTSPAPPRSPGP